MSWLPKNYDKVALSAAALVAVAVGYTVFSGTEEVPAPRPANPNNNTVIPQREVLEKTIETFDADYEFEPKQIYGIEKRSFIAFPLYSVKGKPDLIPLTDDYEIHPGMPFGWWKKYDLEDYGQSDGPELDADNDGFTNREEFNGKTNPTDPKDHPNFIAKLQCNAAVPTPFEMGWTKQNDEIGLFTFKYDGRRLFYGPLGVGDKFPPSARDKSLIDRFEIKEKAQDPEIAGEGGEYYLLQDNGENQNKKQFKLYYRKRDEFKDWTATFLLSIDGSQPFDVPEGGSFSLPYDKNAKLKPYTFKSKEGNKAEIEFDDNGKKSTYELDIPPPANS